MYLGYSISDDELNRAFVRFKELADKKKEISNADLESLVNDEMQTILLNKYKMIRIQVLCGDQQVPTATATIFDEKSQKETTLACTGTGPVDAAYKAIRKQIPEAINVKLLDYTVASVTAGIDALAEVTVRLEDPDNNSRVVFGRSSNIDIIVASAQAYVNALNRLISLKESQHQKTIHPQANV